MQQIEKPREARTLPYIDVTVPSADWNDLSGGASAPYRVWHREQIEHLAKLVDFEIESLPLVTAVHESGDRTVRIFGW